MRVHFAIVRFKARNYAICLSSRRHSREHAREGERGGGFSGLGSLPGSLIRALAITLSKLAVVNSRLLNINADRNIVALFMVKFALNGGFFCLFEIK